jgi:hypothetical protein
MDEDKENINVLIILIDMNPYIWGKRNVNKKMSFTQFLNHLLFFINTFLLSKSKNKLSILDSYSK